MSCNCDVSLRNLTGNTTPPCLPNTALHTLTEPSRFMDGQWLRCYARGAL